MSLCVDEHSDQKRHCHVLLFHGLCETDKRNVCPSVSCGTQYFLEDFSATMALLSRKLNQAYNVEGKLCVLKTIKYSGKYFALRETN